MTDSKQPVFVGNNHSLNSAQVFEPSDVLVFIEDAAMTKASISHAQKIANAFGGKVVLVQVLFKSESGDGPIDPVEWDIKKQHSLKQLELLAERSENTNQPCSVALLEGQCVSQIKAFMEQRRGDIAASLRCRDQTNWPLSETAWGVLLSQSAGVLMIPDDAKITPDVGYRRILLPLDGSSRAETALQKTITLARAEAAELILCYVIPDSGLTEFGQKDPEAESLHRRVRKQNELSGTTYLARIKKKLEQSGLKVSVRISHAGDARRALLDVMTQEKVDFVVMATHGQSGYKDVPTGDVARFLLDRADTPVLLVRPRNGHTNNHAFGDVLSTGARLPSGTD